MNTTDASPGRKPLGGVLGLIERVGNVLPDPVMLFLGATVLIVLLSGIGGAMDWSVQPVRPRVVTEIIAGPDGTQVARPIVDAAGRPRVELIDSGSPISPRSLMSIEGVYWLVSNLVRNFINFPPLGVVLVSMFGIGVAERVGLFGAAMRQLATIVPSRALTPVVIFLGIMTNVASDAGYIVLPPLAAGLYAAFGRPPLAGVAAAFAGIAAGFSANLFPAPTDTIMAPLTERGAQVLEPAYAVLATCNYYFLAGSTFLLTLVGWFVTARIVEPRLVSAGELAPPVVDAGATLSPGERRGLWAALFAMLATVAVVGGLILIPGAPLHGLMPAPAPPFGPVPVDPPATPPGGTLAPRWTQAIVPLILLLFLVPGVAFGICSGAIKKAGDVSEALIHAMKSMAPVIAVAFFAAQFIEAMRFSRFDAMLANVGGKALVAADLPTPLMIVAMIALTMFVNLLMASMSAKWTAMAPIVVPMLMMAGVSPELTQACYRLGDSCTNVVTPLNTYIIVILAVCQKYRKDFGIGNVIALMVPYAFIFAIVWTLFLLAWVMLGVPLGPGAPMWYHPEAM